MLEWDEAKRLKNLSRRGLDFADADLVFDGRSIATAPSRRNNEDRFVSTAEIDGKLSFRRASDGEERAYRQIFG